MQPSFCFALRDIGFSDTIETGGTGVMRKPNLLLRVVSMIYMISGGARTAFFGIVIIFSTLGQILSENAIDDEMMIDSTDLLMLFVILDGIVDFAAGIAGWKAGSLKRCRVMSILLLIMLALGHILWFAFGTDFRVMIWSALPLLYWMGASAEVNKNLE